MLACRQPPTRATRIGVWARATPGRLIGAPWRSCLAHLRRALFDEVAHALLGGGVALRDGRHERLDEQPLALWRLRDARQRLHHRVVGQRRIGRDAPCDLDAARQALAISHPVVREARGLALVGVEHAAGEHHVGHAREADEPRHARRAASAHEEPALPSGRPKNALSSATRMCALLASSSPPPTTAPCSTATTGRRPNCTWSIAACHWRECAMPSKTSRSDISDRSSPAQKCSPAPLSTTARTGSARVAKQDWICAISVSLMALRLPGRFSRTCAMSPAMPIESRSRAASAPPAGVKSAFMGDSILLIMLSRSSGSNF